MLAKGKAGLYIYNLKVRGEPKNSKRSEPDEVKTKPYNRPAGLSLC